MRWGNVRVTSAAGGKLKGEFVPNGDFKKTKKKLTWLANVDDIVPVKLTEFDYLITKPKIEDGEDFKNFVNPHTMAESDGLGDPGLRLLQKGDVIQLERRGFFRCDQPYIGPQKPLVLYMIPDGKTKSMSSLSTAMSHR